MNQSMSMLSSSYHRPILLVVCFYLCLLLIATSSASWSTYYQIVELYEQPISFWILLMFDDVGDFCTLSDNGVGILFSLVISNIALSILFVTLLICLLDRFVSVNVSVAYTSTLIVFIVGTPFLSGRWVCFP